MKLDLPSRIIKNNSLIKLKLLLSLVIVSTISVVFCAVGALTVTAQNEKKIITLSRTIKPQLKITEIKVGKQIRTFNEGFDAESEWVKNLSFKLENVSSKPIVYLKVNVNFPETRASSINRTRFLPRN